MATFIDSATGGTYTTGAGGFTTGGSAKAGGGINPTTGKYDGGSSAQPEQRQFQPLQPQTMSLDQARGEADKAFSGLVAPMTLEQIRAREAETKAGVEQTASAVYDPNISREKQVGASQVSTAEGVVGQRQGFNISTAEQAFVADVQNKVLDRVREVENIKANYISQGNLAAAERADTQLQQLNEWNTQMTIAKAEYALKVMSGAREDARLGLEQDRFNLEQRAQSFNEGMAEKNLNISIAQLTGDYNGSPTFAATQAKIENALAEANLTGFYNGSKTLEAVTTEAQLALQREGIDIERDRLSETIRSNRAQEGLSAARLASESGDKDKTPGQVTDETVARLIDMKNSGTLNDANFQAELRGLGSYLGYAPEELGVLHENLVRAMEGDPVYKEWLKNQANQTHSSDFIIETPTTGSTQAGKAIYDFMSKGGILPAIQAGWMEAGSAFSNFVSGLIGGRGMTRDEINEVKTILGATYK